MSASKNPTKWTAELVKGYVESHNCKWIGDKYTRMKHKEKFIMKCGHEWERV